MSMKTYLVKKIFGPTIQGEGALTGTVCVFIRFAGCNMWDGRSETKAASACPYCDTDFRGGERLTSEQIVERVNALLPSKDTLNRAWVVVSGGEPLLQFDAELAEALDDAFYSIAIETNGTVDLDLRLRRLVSHLTVSPKVPRNEMKLRSADEIKLLYPHPNPRIQPEHFSDFVATHKFIQPIGTDDAPGNADAALAKCISLYAGGWRLSLQTHKMIGVE